MLFIGLTYFTTNCSSSFSLSGYFCSSCLLSSSTTETERLPTLYLSLSSAESCITTARTDPTVLEKVRVSLISVVYSKAARRCSLCFRLPSQTFCSPQHRVMAMLSQARVAGWASRWLTDELVALSKAGNWEAAISTFLQLQQANIVQSNVFHYTTVISACGRAGKWEAAMSIFDQMTKNEVKPNVYTYTAVINACASAEKADVALRMFAHMRLADVPPNVQTMTALVNACARSGEWERAIKILRDCEELFVAPNVFTYTAAMDGCRRGGVWKPAVDLLNEMRDPARVRPNEVTYNTVINACAVASELNAALQVYATMVSDGYTPVNFTKTLLMQLFRNTALSGLADELKVRKTTWREINVPDTDPATALEAVREDSPAVEEEEEEGKG
ncbi:pentatricopeptide repeat domain containing protein [Trypanosoma brucei equiperdum]|uniref:Pentatricopeptide repeat domain containing protein n=1 Tax=Trypanosoma brucei equiperdum TaxID=630700 RepID=A0A3L6L182_9TRYP|nr:pentatricopeptide repeat domain containing protein [Trypanosoma brucei equiperdum]